MRWAETDDGWQYVWMNETYMAEQPAGGMSWPMGREYGYPAPGGWRSGAMEQLWHARYGAYVWPHLGLWPTSGQQQWWLYNASITTSPGWEVGGRIVMDLSLYPGGTTSLNTQALIIPNQDQMTTYGIWGDDPHPDSFPYAGWLVNDPYESGPWQSYVFAGEQTMLAYNQIVDGPVWSYYDILYGHAAPRMPTNNEIGTTMGVMGMVNAGRMWRSNENGPLLVDILSEGGTSVLGTAELWFYDPDAGYPPASTVQLGGRLTTEWVDVPWYRYLYDEAQLDATTGVGDVRWGLFYGGTQIFKYVGECGGFRVRSPWTFDIDGPMITPAGATNPIGFSLTGWGRIKQHSGISRGAVDSRSGFFDN